MPSAAASAFMRATKSSTLPLPSVWPMAKATSLADFTSIMRKAVSSRITDPAG